MRATGSDTWPKGVRAGVQTAWMPGPLRATTARAAVTAALATCFLVGAGPALASAAQAPALAAHLTEAGVAGPTARPAERAPARPGTSAPSPVGSPRVPAGLQVVIDKALASQPVTSPSGITLSWGQRGRVWFRAPKARSGGLALTPKSVGRASGQALSPGGFVFGAKSTTEPLGDGVSVWYKAAASGFEQGFTLERRPSGAGARFSIVLGYGGGLHATASGPGTLSLLGPKGPVMTYGALRVTDATGRALPSHFSLGTGEVRIVVSDAGATYPLTVDPFVWPSTTPVATVTGTDGAYLGTSVALSADGQEALVGAPNAGSNGDGAVFVYAETGGTWSTNPVATIAGSANERLGGPVMLSVDGGTALLGSPATGDANGAAYVYTGAGASWSATPVASFTGTGGNYSFGSSIALSADGQAALVGAPSVSSGAGAVYVYSTTGGVWSSTPTTIFTGGADAGLGGSVALSADGQVALLGAPGDPSTGSESGAAYLYTETGGNWPTAATVTYTGTSNEELGYSVALSADGQEALVGAPNAGSLAGAPPGAQATGAVYIYDEVGSTWSTTPVATLTGTLGQGFGAPISLSADGQTVLVGAALAGPYGGAAYLYAEPGASWSTTPAATFSGTSPDGTFGSALALSADGQVVLVGAPNAGPDGLNSYGTASLYAASTYTATDLGTLPGFGYSSTASGINDNSEVVGTSFSPTQTPNAFAWTAPGGMVDLGTLPGSAGSYANAVNNEGQVVGASGYISGDAFSYTPAGGMVDLGTLPGQNWSDAYGVNDSGEVVGSSGLSGSGSVLPFSWSAGGGMVELTTPPGGEGSASAVNDDGEAVGWSWSGGTAYGDAAAWTSAGALVDLGTLPGAIGSEATGVNDNGEVVGYSIGPNGITGDAFAYTPTGGMVDLGTLPGQSWSEATAVNDNGEVVGVSGNYAFSWTPAGGMVELAPAPGGGISSAAAVTDNGDVVGLSNNATLWQAGVAPSVTSAPSTTFAVATAASVTVTATGYPAPIFWEIGPLPSGVQFEYNNNGTATLSGTPAAGTGGAYPLTIMASNGISPDATQSFTLTVLPAPQTITFNAPTSGTVGGTATLSATGGASGNPVVFSVDPTSGSGVCAVSGTNGTTLNYSAVGNCVIDANQAGNTNYSAAPQVQRTITVGQGPSSSGGGGTPPILVGLSPSPQTINFTAPASASVGNSATLSATGGASGNPVVFSVDGSSGPGVCAVTGTNGGTFNFTAAGDCVVDANQAGNADYSAAPQVQRTIVVIGAEALGQQTISFAPLANRALLQSPLTLGATASSGLTVVFTTGTPSVCTLGGADRSTVGLLNTGISTIQAAQLGNSSYDAAAPVSRSFEVTRASQVIDFGTITKKGISQSPVTVRATASSGLSVSFTTTTLTVCAVEPTGHGTKIILLEAGICTVRASQAGNATYSPAKAVRRSFTVTKTARPTKPLVRP